MTKTTSLPETVQDILQVQFEEIRLRSPAFSQRAFAQKLGLSSGALSELMRARRPITAKLAEQLATQLALKAHDRKRLGLQPLPENPSSRVNLPEDAFQVIANWCHFAILNLTKAKGFRSQPLWIAKRLNIPLVEAEHALARLLRLGLLKKENGKLARTFKRVNTSDEIMSRAIQRAHAEDFELIKRALAELSVEKRDSSSITFTLNAEQVAEVKRRLREIQDDILDFADKEPGSEVYRLSMHLFPLTTGKVD